MGIGAVVFGDGDEDGDGCCGDAGQGEDGVETIGGSGGNGDESCKDGRGCIICPAAFISIPVGRSLRAVENGGKNCSKCTTFDHLFIRKVIRIDALISAQNAPKCVWRPGSARTRWGSSQTP